MSYFKRSTAFDPAEFLRDYWQQKPLLIKGFFDEFEDPIDGAELAGLAMEEGVESRLIELAPPDNYQLEHGPFTESRFLQTNSDNWTLLVQAVDELLPEIAMLKQAFDFLPSWRIDDVMISFATPGGGVGPHTDYYDVFLIQGAGQRQWKLGKKLAAESGKNIDLDQHEVTDSGLKLLREFKLDQELTLETGDVLYIPPGVPHWGTALSEGLCYSVGFRAPSQAEMIEAFSDGLMDLSAPNVRFQDGEPPKHLQTGEISVSDVQRAWQALQQRLGDGDLFLRCFGELTTQPRYPERIIPLELAEAQDEMTATNLVRSPSARFAWLSPPSSDAVWLFVNGELFEQPSSNLQAVVSLCDLSIDNVKEISSAHDEQTWQDLMLDLVMQGSLFSIESITE